MTQNKDSRIWRKIGWALKSISLTPCVCSVTKSDLTLDCLLLCGPEPARLLGPWNAPGKNTGAGCHFLLQGSSQLRDWNHISCIDRLYVFNTYLWIIYYVSGTVLPGEQEIRFCFQRKTQHLLPVIMCKQLKFLLKREMVKQWHKQW